MDTASHTGQVLVVGAGPVGLTLALDLARRGTPVRIIDALTAPTTESRAIVIHSRSLDQLEALGALDEILAHGRIAHGMEMHARGKHLASISFSGIDAVHPYSVAIVQTDTEAVLTAALRDAGVEIDRGRTLTSMTLHDDHVDAVITTSDGSMETMSVAYLVGADGARSTVRHLIGERFDGAFSGEDFLVGDVEAEHPYDPGLFHTFFSPGNETALLFGLPGDRVRAFAQLPSGTDPDRPATVEWLQEALDERQVALRILTAHWLTRFELKHGQVPRYRAGRVFLAGDAAHIHSPAGGLGMNTGMQDATNLGWKLARVLSGAGGERLLDTYQSERHPVAAAVISFTSGLSRVGTLHNPIAQSLRNTGMHLGLSIPAVSEHLADIVEQQDVRYRDSPIVSGRARRLHAGDFLRVPGMSVAAALAQADGHLLVSRDDDPPGLRVRADDLTTLEIDADSRRRLAVSVGRDDGVVIVRPDGYVGYVGSGSSDDVAAYFAGLAA